MNVSLKELEKLPYTTVLKAVLDHEKKELRKEAK